MVGKKQNKADNTKKVPEADHLIEVVRFACFVSKTEPKSHKEALVDEYWIAVMQDELE